MKRYSNYTKFISIALVALVACNNSKNEKAAQLLKKGIHTAVVEEAVQTSQYTYLRLTEVGNPAAKTADTLWVAATMMETKKGDTLYYKGGFPMANFKSKELNRSFKSVLFLDSLSSKPDFGLKEKLIGNGHNPMSSTSMGGASGTPKIEKIEVKIPATAGITTIADLYAKKAAMAGKTVKVKGQVTKFSADIMNTNWLHIQDGTDKDGKFDLTITTGETLKVGDVVCFEGKISVDKNIGQGYFYEVLMEDAKIIK